MTTQQTGISVSVTDLSNGETESAAIENDHIVVCAGTAYISSVVAYGNRTQVITVKHAESAEDAARQQTKITRHFGPSAFGGAS